ncbi:anthranilate synthase component I family protein [Microbacterium sp. 18062]|uniref:anthranilate synthase component I family protein n=1 Tax=Microbacterium sp. 18062 TaxID=2681410 RepID=UPI00190F546C|nr:anthranilate synthase component I family protein [Microbacterium sp. 18062]
MLAVATPVPLDHWVDPERVYPAFSEAPDSFWLDAGPAAREGWSWMGTGTVGDPAEVRSVRVSRHPERTSLSGPLERGWVGWLGYEAGAAVAGAPTAPDDLPAERWMRVDTLVAFDHAAQRVWVVADDPAPLVRRITAMPDPAGAPRPAAAGVAHARVSATEYAELIRDCRAAIRRGEAYLLCLTTRFSVAGDVDPVAAHAALRAASPSHHGALIRTGGIALVSASPERFLDVSDGLVRTRPIKGTRPRGRTPEEDGRNASDLRADPKERAENVMIVDLMRNDLARVCDPATVTVERLLEVETYATVHQLVSTIAGRVREGTTVGELWSATFPAGSMTGAPKLSAMTILQGLEGAPRGAFSGCFGWVGDDGRLDLAMTIRTIVTLPGAAYVGAGGGITWASVPDAEVAEVALKAAAPLRAIGAEPPADWDRRGPVT